ncbi:hypothetical protein pb186bvf_020247 [Paramecium bursaria]
MCYIIQIFWFINRAVIKQKIYIILSTVIYINSNDIQKQ